MAMRSQARRLSMRHPPCGEWWYHPRGVRRRRRLSRFSVTASDVCNCKRAVKTSLLGAAPDGGGGSVPPAAPTARRGEIRLARPLLPGNKLLQRPPLPDTARAAEPVARHAREAGESPGRRGRGLLRQAGSARYGVGRPAPPFLS